VSDRVQESPNVLFDAENKHSILPVVAGKQAGCETTGRRARFSQHAIVEHPGFTPEIAKVFANIKSRPIVPGIDCRNGRLRIRLRGQISGGRRVDANDCADRYRRRNE
jgi:hypothetical protein